MAIAVFAFLIAAFLVLAIGVRSAGLYVAMAIDAVMLVLCIWIVYARARKLGTMIDGYALIWISFTVVYPLSAMVHLIGAEGQTRGFYDLVRSGYSPNLENIYYSLLLTFIAFIALWVGLKSSKSTTKNPPSKLVLHVPLILALGILFTITGIIGTLKLFTEYSSLTKGLLVVDRSREIGGGLARYVFMSQWISWGLIFLMVCFLKTSLAKSKLAVMCFIVPFAVLIVGNIFWTGGRASAIIALIPGLFLLQRIRGKYSNFPVIFVGLLILVYFVTVTSRRSTLISAASSDELLIDVLDWHIGRFSMIGLAVEMVNIHGFVWGSTLLAGLANAVNSPLVLLKIPQIVGTPQGITSIVGMHLVGNPEITGIVPGTICELYYNFGLFGVAGGYFLIGKLLQKCIKVTRDTQSIGVFTLTTYIIVLICTNFIPGTFTSWIYYLVTIGFPAIFLFISEALFKKTVHGNKYIFKYKST